MRHYVTTVHSYGHRGRSGGDQGFRTSFPPVTSCLPSPYTFRMGVCGPTLIVLEEAFVLDVTPVTPRLAAAESYLPLLVLRDMTDEPYLVYASSLSS